MTSIRAVPKRYRNVLFRSTLEADWASTLDLLKIEWSYEPEAVQLPSGIFYRPDFWLPRISTWLEVKGPSGDRLEKTYELADAVSHRPDCPGDPQPDPSGWHFGCGNCGWFDPWQAVIIGESPLGDQVTCRFADPEPGTAELATCTSCHSWFFYSHSRSYRCRACGCWEGDHHLGLAFRPEFRRVG